MKNWPSLMVVYPWLSTPFFDLVNCVIFPLHVNICLHFFLFFFWFWKMYNYLGYLMCYVFFSDFSYCSLKDFNKKDFWQPNKTGIRFDRLQCIWSVCPVRKKIEHPTKLEPFLYSVSILASQSCVFTTATTLMNHFNLPGNWQFAKTISENRLELVLIIRDTCIVSKKCNRSESNLDVLSYYRCRNTYFSILLTFIFLFYGKINTYTNLC